MPAITSKIIPPDLSVRQGPVRPVAECRPAIGSEKKIQRSVTMRFMVIVKANKDSEAGVMPGTELLTAMGNFNEEMAKAGVIRAGGGLPPRSAGTRVKSSRG